MTETFVADIHKDQIPTLKDEIISSIRTINDEYIVNVVHEPSLIRSDVEEIQDSTFPDALNESTEI